MNRNPKKTRSVALALCIGIAGLSGAAVGAPGDEVLATYGKGPFSAAAGKTFWNQKYQTKGESRSCATCHGDDLTKPGERPDTRKVIEPMAVSVNPKRLTDPAKVEKWFKKNCPWTLDRECTPQEKGDVVKYLQSL